MTESSFKRQIRQQLKQNTLAIISLIVAIVALSYNTWRNEQSEQNRNLRSAGFEILRESARLQLLIDLSTYANNIQPIVESVESHSERQANQQYSDAFNRSDGQLISGWVSVNLMQTLAELIQGKTQIKAQQLKQVWSEQWSSLAESEQANIALTDANQALVNAVNKRLAKLR